MSKEEIAQEAQAAAASLRLVARELRRTRRMSLLQVAETLAQQAETLAEHVRR